MKANNSKLSSQANRPAYTILILLVVVAIIAVIFCIQFGGPFRRVKQDASSRALPWQEEFRLLKPGQGPKQLPSPEQLDITHTIRFTVEVQQERISAGQMQLSIAPGGAVQGSWSADYDTPSQMNYVMDADFKGNIDPSKIYEDDYGEDPSKLYIIAKGYISQLETNFKTSKVRRKGGYIYVTGWIDPDQTAAGKITITEDKSEYRTLNWKTAQW